MCVFIPSQAVVNYLLLCFVRLLVIERCTLMCFPFQYPANQSRSSCRWFLSQIRASACMRGGNHQRSASLNPLRRERNHRCSLLIAATSIIRPEGTRPCHHRAQRDNNDAVVSAPRTATMRRTIIGTDCA